MTIELQLWQRTLPNERSKSPEKPRRRCRHRQATIASASKHSARKQDKSNPWPTKLFRLLTCFILVANDDINSTGRSRYND